MENKKTVKKIVFKIKDEQVYTINADDVVVSDIEDLRDAIAIHYELENKEDVIFESVDVLERTDLSKNTMIGSSGRLHCRTGSNRFFVPVTSIVPYFDINTENGYQQFLDLIFNNDIDGAVSFR